MRQIVWLHGIPGGPQEADLFGAPPWRDDDRVFVPDRNRMAAAHVPGAIAETFPEGPIILIGFSLGARVALDCAAALGNRVGQLHLISAAAPADRSGIFKAMAGGPLFAMAQARPALFAVVVRLQSWLARTAPHLLVRMLFASAQGADQALATDAGFKRQIAALLKNGLGQQATGYHDEIRAYVTAWRDTLARVSAPVSIWHGDADNWSPFSMADDLAASLPGPVTLHRLAGLSHYSALKHAINQIAG